MCFPLPSVTWFLGEGLYWIVVYHLSALKGGRIEKMSRDVEVRIPKELAEDIRKRGLLKYYCEGFEEFVVEAVRLRVQSWIRTRSLEARG